MASWWVILQLPLLLLFMLRPPANLLILLKHLALLIVVDWDLCNFYIHIYQDGNEHRNWSVNSALKKEQENNPEETHPQLNAATCEWLPDADFSPGSFKSHARFSRKKIMARGFRLSTCSPLHDSCRRVCSSFSCQKLMKRSNRALIDILRCLTLWCKPPGGNLKISVSSSKTRNKMRPMGSPYKESVK